MITCKEDLNNTYIINDRGELRDLFLGKCREFGLLWVSGKFPFDSNVGINSNKIGVISGVIQSDATGRMLTIEDLKPQTKEVEWVNGDSCVWSGIDAVFIGYSQSQKSRCAVEYLRGGCSIIDTVFIEQLSKPETPEQKLEREELEAAYDLRCTFNEDNFIISFDEFKNHHSLIREKWLKIVRKTNYKVKGE
ncbi:hypothetical protein VPH209E381_0098 [Vibrio phage 209E38-1]